MKVASFHMVGAAYSWYKWLVRNQYTDDWNEFTEALRNRFGTDLYENPREVLKELHQTGSIAEYQQQFETLSNKVHGLSESWIVSFFIAGLQDFLKCQLRLARPQSYPEAVALARLHEHNHLALKQSLRDPTPQVARAKQGWASVSPNLPRPGSVRHAETGSVPLAAPPINQAGPVPAALPAATKPSFKKLTAAELKARRQ